MALETRGLCIAGEIIPGTEWLRRDTRAWWVPGQYGTRPRAAVTDLAVVHWTAGEAGLKSYTDDGPIVVTNMRERRNPSTAKRLRVSITFVVGACDDDDEFAEVWQCLDPALTAATHVGKGSVNARSVGIEIVGAGLPSMLDTRNRPRVRRIVHGLSRQVLIFYPGQLRALGRLLDALTALHSPMIEIPRAVPVTQDGALYSKAFTAKQQRRWRGVQEHLHVPGTSKLDAGTLAIEALSERPGWEATVPIS